MRHSFRLRSGNGYRLQVHHYRKLMQHTNNRLFLTVAVGIILMISGMNIVHRAEAQEKSDRFFTINLIVPIGNTPREKAGQILARDLEKIGIGVNLHYMEFASITPRWKASVANHVAFDDGGFDLYMAQSSMDAVIDPSGLYTYFACDQQHPNGSNTLLYCNPEFDQVIYQALQTVEAQTRGDFVKQAERILYEDLPTIPLWRPSQFYGIQSSVKFPEHHDPQYWTTYAFRWAWRELKEKTKEQMSLRERTLVYAQPADIDAFLTGYSSSTYSDRAIDYMVYDALMHQTIGPYNRGPEEDRGPQPALADHWDVSEDGKTWTIYLRNNVVWHDGTPFTADDVLFTYELRTNKEAGYGSDAFIHQNGITWKKIDEYTVQFMCEQFNPLFASEILDIPILPQHLFSTVPYAELAKSDFNTGKRVIGTGPWILEEYKPAEYLKFKVNESYYGGRPWFDAVVIRIIPQGATAWYALKTGEVDVTEAWYGFTRELAELKADPQLYAFQQPFFGPQMLLINNEHPILKDVLVRRAISLAANRRVMVDVISDGLGVVAGQHLPEWSPGYNPNIPPLEYDLEQAKRLLEQAGYHYETISIEGPQS